MDTKQEDELSGEYELGDDDSPLSPLTMQKNYSYYFKPLKQQKSLKSSKQQKEEKVQDEAEEVKEDVVQQEIKPTTIAGFQRQLQKAKEAAFLSLLTFEIDKNPFGYNGSNLYNDEKTCMVDTTRQRVTKALEVYHTSLLSIAFYGNCTMQNLIYGSSPVKHMEVITKPEQ